MAAISFPVRPSSTYRPTPPRDTFLQVRSSYRWTPTNPKKQHRGVDISGYRILNAIIQLPEESKLIDKGWDPDGAGHWMEWQVRRGPWKGRFMRFFHMSRPCGFRPGTVKPRKYAVGRVGNTGNSTGPHVHFELAKTRWDQGRDPRWNPTQALRDAVAAKDY